MHTVAFFDTKEYDRIYFDKFKEQFNIKIKYFEGKLNENSAIAASGCDAVVAFVNDTIDKNTIDALLANNIKIIAMRCAGYNNIDLKYAQGKIKIYRVPAYSPYAVAEYAMGMLLAINRKVHKSYIRTRDFNFSLNGLVGSDLHAKTVGIVGTGKIGQIFADICRGFGMNIIAYDLYPNENLNIKYVDFDTLCRQSDVISLHCPLTDKTHHIVDRESIMKMKRGVFLINTSRGALVDSEALLDGLRERKIGAAALDVYEEEEEYFFEDKSSQIVLDETLSLLLSMPNVLVSSHQAFLTQEALSNIAEVTLENLSAFFRGTPTENEVSYEKAAVKS